MGIVDKLQTMDAKQLAQLELNARDMLKTGNEKKKLEAQIVLAGIVEERASRDQAEQARRRAAVQEIRLRVVNLGLFERTILAFERIPPAAWEISVLNAIAQNPDADFDTLAHLVDKREGGYINLAVGTTCSTREPYLGTAPASTSRKGEKNYSSLIIDFTPHKRSDGSTWHGWTLKPEVEAALRHIGVVSGKSDS
jgi:hypothetical protein